MGNSKVYTVGNSKNFSKLMMRFAKIQAHYQKLIKKGYYLEDLEKIFMFKQEGGNVFPYAYTFQYEMNRFKNKYNKKKGGSKDGA